MQDGISTSQQTQTGPPLATYRFLVTFFGDQKYPADSKERKVIVPKALQKKASENKNDKSKELKPNEIDIRFQEVSGMSADFAEKRIDKLKKASVSTKTMAPPSFPNLTLKRGFVPGNSPLRIQIEKMLVDFKENAMSPKNILIMLLSDDGEPVTSWLFMNARLMTYSLGNFDATTSAFLVESMEFSFDHWYPISL